MEETNVVVELNEQQREAVMHGNGPLLVLAGAGSGKTRVITTRIAALVADGTSPRDVLALTFTNKAAAEMRHRLGTMLGGRAGELWMSTFHSAAAQILRRHIHHLGYTSSFSIFDEQDCAKLLRQCLAEEGIDERAGTPAAIAWAIDRAKNEGLDPEALARRPSSRDVEVRVYRRYQRLLKRQNAVDFGDLIMLAARVLREESQVLAGYRARLRHVLVDEYQDTNRAQYLLLRLLADGERPNLCVVGDDDQSIYGWRGAEIRNILDFERDFPDAKVVRLEQNYRSTKTILAAAGAVVANNSDRKGKTLWTANPQGAPVTVAVAEDDLAEARLVMAEVRRLVSAGRRLHDIVIFYRTNAQSRAVEEAAMRAAMPYTIVGGIRFYERKEIKDLLAYLRVLANPADDVSLARIINTPARGIGDQTVSALRLAAREADCSITELLRRTPPPPGLAATSAARVRAFADLLDALRATLDGTSVAIVVERLLEMTAYRERLDGAEGERTSRIENIDELLAVARDFDERSPLGETARTRLERFLEEAALVSDWDRTAEARDRLTLMTLHTSKGLEFPIVFILGMEEGIFPHQRVLGDAQALEEERRVCYVGMTRARAELYLFRAERRLRFGTISERPPSRFLEEIPEQYVKPVSTSAKPFRRPLERRAPSDPIGSSDPVMDYSYRQESPESFAEGGSLLPGTKVRHPTFGVGIVRRSEGRGEQEKLMVQFARVGMKKLIRRFANLETVNDGFDGGNPASGHGRAAPFYSR
ncbi:MAG: UvrD-helicase domain-containing protein [Dehalococcoidia bacterium]|nr:UvrD-helicase domain-containing protein [Dehalococcoidia bacterium]